MPLISFYTLAPRKYQKTKGLDILMGYRTRLVTRNDFVIIEKANYLFENTLIFSCSLIAFPVNMNFAENFQYNFSRMFDLDVFCIKIF